MQLRAEPLYERNDPVDQARRLGLEQYAQDTDRLQTEPPRRSLTVALVDQDRGDPALQRQRDCFGFAFIEVSRNTREALGLRTLRYGDMRDSCWLDGRSPARRSQLPRHGRRNQHLI